MLTGIINASRHCFLAQGRNCSGPFHSVISVRRSWTSEVLSSLLVEFLIVPSLRPGGIWNQSGLLISRHLHVFEEHTALGGEAGRQRRMSSCIRVASLDGCGHELTPQFWWRFQA
eukprot:4098278-Amphidinium_carterae.1